MMLPETRGGGQEGGSRQGYLEPSQTLLRTKGGFVVSDGQHGDFSLLLSLSHVLAPSRQVTNPRKKELRLQSRDSPFAQSGWGL